MNAFNNSSLINVVLICGIPGCGKTVLSNNIASWIKSHQPSTEVIIMEFDQIEKVHKDNYSNFQLMRDDFVSQFSNLLNRGLSQSSKEKLFILDDNFFLKSMRKKIYQIIYDFIFKRNRDDFQLANYCEVFLQCDTSFAIEMNDKREKSRRIPQEVIEKMSKDFEYNSTHIKDKMSYSYGIKCLKDLELFPIEALMEYIRECKVMMNQFDEEALIQKPPLTKSNESLFIDELELMLRKGISLKIKEVKLMSNKDISSLKKAFVKATSQVLSQSGHNKIQSNVISIKEIEMILSSKTINRVNELSAYFLSLIK